METIRWGSCLWFQLFLMPLGIPALPGTGFFNLLGFCLFKLDFTSLSSSQNLNPHFHEPHPESCMRFCICNFILFFKNYSLTELCQFNAPRNRNSLLNLINKTSLLWFSVNSFVKDKKSFLNAAKILWLDYSIKGTFLSCPIYFYNRWEMAPFVPTFTEIVRRCHWLGTQKFEKEVTKRTGNLRGFQVKFYLSLPLWNRQRVSILKGQLLKWKF